MSAAKTTYGSTPPLSRINRLGTHQVDKLIGMGFPRDRAIAALQRSNNDADTAADILLGGGSAEVYAPLSQDP
jgi:hypothetical protein